MLRRYFFIFLFLPTFAISTQHLFAQEEEKQDDISYTVNVTADRLEESINDKSDSITIISHDEIERHQWHYVQDALRTVPGLAVVRSGSPGKTTSVFVRGASSAQVLVLVDGIQVNDPFFGDVSLEDLTTENVERIEIVKGPQSTLYGSDAIAGVINIITRKGQQGFHPHLNFEAGSLETYREGANVSGANENTDYTLAFTRNDSQGQFNNDEFHLNSFSGRGGYKFNSSTNLTVTGRLEDSQIGIPFNSSYFPSPFRNQESRLSLLGTNLHHSSGKSLNLTTKFNWTGIHSLFEDPDDAFSSFSQHDSDVLQLGLQNDFHIGSNNTLLAGYEFERQSIDSEDNNGPVPDLNGFKSNIHAAYAQNKFETQHWILTAGLRFDHHSTFGDSTNPRISIAYRPEKQWKIRASAGTAFRAPTAGDLAFPFYGNPNLKPEKSRSWEVGFDNQNNTFSYSATWFHNKYEDLITFDPNTFVAGNVAKAKSQGLEFSSAVQYHSWHLSAVYTYLDTEDEIEKHELFRRPKHSGNIQLDYETSRWGSSLLLLLVGDRLETDFRTFPTRNVINPGYLRSDLAGFYRFNQQWKLHARIENLFDANYEEALTFQAPGISFYGGVAASF